MRFDDVLVDAAAVDDEQLRRVANALVALDCLDLVGVGEAVIDRTVDYTKMREQFGRPIASFQAAQHLVADMHIALAAARLAARSAVFWIGRGRTATRETAVARMRAAEVKKITLDAHQLHGGMGYVVDTGLHLFSERARILATLGGGADIAAKWLEDEMNWNATPMTADSLIDPESAAKVGQVVAVATGEVYRRDWQRWAAAVGDHNPLWFDPDYARQHGYRDIVCPPLYLQYAILGVSALGDLRPDGSSGAATGSMAFPKAPRRMAGGENTTFHLPAYHGDEIEMARTVDSIVEKEGRSGRFVLVTWRSEYRNQHRELRRRGHHVDDRQAGMSEACERINRHRMRRPRRRGRRMSAQVYFEDVDTGDAIPLLTVTVDETQLFFFSAATYNGHRIHYDKEWARDVEGYDDVLVQGPLQAALLSRALTDWIGGDGRLVAFSVQNRAVAHPGQALSFGGVVTGKRGDGHVDLDIFCKRGDDVLMPGTATVALPQRDSS